jgi:hypothetical protein
VFLLKYEKDVVGRWKRQQMKAATKAALKEEKDKANKEKARAAEREERRQQTAKRKEKETEKERSKDKRRGKDREKVERQTKSAPAAAAAPKLLSSARPAAAPSAAAASESPAPSGATPAPPPIPASAPGAAAAAPSLRRQQRAAQELKSPDIAVRVRARGGANHTHVVRHVATDEQALAQYSGSAEGAHYRCSVARLPLVMSHEERQARKERDSAWHLQNSDRVLWFSEQFTSFGSCAFLCAFAPAALRLTVSAFLCSVWWSEQY